MSSSNNYTLQINEDVFKIYALTTAILVGKMLLMSPLTSRQRLIKKIFANPEDASYFPEGKDGKVKLDDPDVERVRRAHRNDLESIPPYLFVSGLYCLSNPSSILAITLMVVYTLSRIGHTYVYAVSPKPQPARAIFWGVGYGITMSLTFGVLLRFLNK